MLPEQNNQSEGKASPYLFNILTSPTPRFGKVNYKEFESPIQLMSKSSQPCSLRSSVSNQHQNASLSTNKSNGSHCSHNRSRNSPQYQILIKHTISIKNIVQRENQDSDYQCQECSCPANQEGFTSEIDHQTQNQMVYSPENMDIFGNLLPIGEFEVQERFSSERQDGEESYLPQIVQDKENQIPPQCTSSAQSIHLYTPLKNKECSFRSPLKDITPTITKKRKKQAQTTNASEKRYLLTPRTLPLTESRLSGSGFRRMERL